MKYIRTKDGIYLNGGKFGKPYSGIVGKKHEYDFGYCFNKKDIIKQADTIEELCNEFVGIDSQGHYIIHNNQWLDGARIIPLEDIEYYGAIWTDKGLIYVAKMNEKGELKLL